jgi:hypothetical protein
MILIKNTVSELDCEQVTSLGAPGILKWTGIKIPRKSLISCDGP